MSTNDKKDKNEELFDHIIEYGASSWTDEISPDNIPEEELSDQLNQKIDNMFSSARKRANRKRRFITARRIAAVFVVLLTMASVTVMSVEAFRVPVLNFIFKNDNIDNTSMTELKPTSKDSDFNFEYMPKGYHFAKKNVAENGTYFMYDYKNSKDNWIFIEINADVNSKTYLNIDKSNYVKFRHHQVEYYYLHGDSNQLLWYKNKCIHKITSSLSKNELLKIAKNIKCMNY